MGHPPCSHREGLRRVKCSRTPVWQHLTWLYLPWTLKVWFPRSQAEAAAARGKPWLWAFRMARAFSKHRQLQERPLSSHSRFSGTAVFSSLLVNTCRAGPAVGGRYTRLLHAQQLRLGPCRCEWELAVPPRPGGGSGREWCGSSFQRAGWEQPERVWATCCLERCPHPSLPDCKILGTQEPNFCWR